MTRPAATLALLIAATLATPCDKAVGQTPSGLAQRLAQLDFGDMNDSPDPIPSLPDPGPDRGDRGPDGPEELAAPEAPAANPGEEEASRLVGYNSMQNPWLPICEDKPSGWLPELPIPRSCLDCTCDGKLPGEACQVWRSFQKPTHPSIDKECVVCVKEPCLGYKKVHYTTDAVVQKCFVSEKCYEENECADGRCIKRKGTRIVKQLHPCKTKVKLFYWKPIVEYRDVYYYINCEKCHEGDQVVAQR